MKRIIFSLTYLMLFAVSAGLMAQETKKEEKKVVIVKRTVDDNGKVTETRQEANGAEADKLIKEIGEGEGIDIEIEKVMDSDGKKKKRIRKRIELQEHEGDEMEEDLEIEERIVDGKTVKSYTLTRSSEGEKEVIKWDGQGEMPQKIKEALEKNEGENMMFGDEDIREIKIMKKGGDEDDVMIWIDEDSDEPIHLKKGMKNKFIEKKKHNDNKVTLGVMVSSESAGVVIDEIIKGSAADEAKLQSGDRITEIDDTPVSDINELLDVLSKYEADDKIKIRYFRNSKVGKTTAKLKARQ